ncbi:hypothetical protein Tco_1496968 [Tanacetum coccineum]
MGEPLGAEVDEPLVDSVIDELAEPIVKVEEQLVTLVMDMEDLHTRMGNLVQFGNEDDSSDDDSKGPEGDEEVWEADKEWLMAPVTPPLMSVMPPSSTYKVGGSSTAAAEGHSLTLLAPRVHVPPSMIEDLHTRMDNLVYGHGLLVNKMITVMASQMVQVVNGLEQVGAHVEQGQQAATQTDETIAGLSQQCILRLDKRLADVERGPLGPQ